MKVNLNRDVVYFMDGESLVITDLNANAQVYKVSGALAKFSYELFQGESTFQELSERFEKDEIEQVRKFLQDLQSLALVKLVESKD